MWPHGKKQGLWYCFKTGEGGHLFQLIQKKCRDDFKEALNYSAELLGLKAASLEKTITQQ
jgi:hypothetical protein